MKKSGKTNRAKPTDTSSMSSFFYCAVIFQWFGWFDLFERIKGFNSEVSYHFSQGFDKDTVSFHTLKFELTRELIIEAIGIVGDGELWFKKIPFTFNPKDFLFP